MKSRANWFLSLILVPMLATLFFGSLVNAATGDLWNKRGIPTGSTSQRDVWHITAAGNLEPGTDNLWKAGGAAKRISGIYCNDLTYSTVQLSTPTTLTAGATLTVSSPTQYLLNMSGAAAVVLPSAITAANRVYDFQDISGGTNVVTFTATAGNINGGSSITFSTAYGGKRFYSNGANWFAR